MGFQLEFVLQPNTGTLFCASNFGDPKLKHLSCLHGGRTLLLDIWLVVLRTLKICTQEHPSIANRGFTTTCQRISFGPDCFPWSQDPLNVNIYAFLIQRDQATFSQSEELENFNHLKVLPAQPRPVVRAFPYTAQRKMCTCVGSR